VTTSVRQPAQRGGAALTGVVIAAGRGARMRHLTAERPKCLLPVGGRALLDHALDHLRRAGCRRLVVVTGYCHEVVAAHLAGRADVMCVHNRDAAHVNVLHSLMCAREHVVGPALVTYSDTLLSRRAIDALLATGGDIVVGVDVDWRGAYVGRDAHPPAEAEKVYVDASGRADRFGKHLADVGSPQHVIGEFIGALRTTANGTRVLVETFAALDSALEPNAAFQAAPQWRQAYLTDLLQECVDRGERVTAARITRGWLEVDTPEDYERLPALAAAQGIDLSPSYPAP
jgi:choline kinase